MKTSYLFFSLLIITALFFTSCKSEPKGAKEYTSPDWAKGIVWYQIFPERFSDGDSNNQQPENEPEVLKVGKSLLGLKIGTLAMIGRRITPTISTPS